MQARLVHANLNITDVAQSIAFYQKALGMQVISSKGPEDGRFVLTFMGDGQSGFQLELTWLRDKEGRYDLGDNESHICFAVDDYDAAHALHAGMGCICYENRDMGLYFIEDPDGYWLEIIPADR